MIAGNKDNFGARLFQQQKRILDPVHLVGNVARHDDHIGFVPTVVANIAIAIAIVLVGGGGGGECCV